MGKMLTRTKTALLALTLTLALATGITSTAQGAKGMEIAVQDDPVLFGGIYGSPLTALDLADRLKVSRIRVNVSWSYVVGKAAKKKKAPKHITYNWTGYDLLYLNAVKHGMKLQLALTGPAPAWATTNHRIGRRSPKAGPFKAFAKAAAQHFKGHVDRYSIWNEPNHRGWIEPTRTAPKVSRALSPAGSSAIKRADRHAKVLFGELSPYGIGHGRHVNAVSPLKFLRSVVCAKKNYR